MKSVIVAILVLFFCSHRFVNEKDHIKKSIIVKYGISGLEDMLSVKNTVNINDQTQSKGNQSVFLSAKWVHLVIISFEIEPEVLQPHIPVGTSLDFYNGKTYISLVAFLFEDTKVLGIIPAFFHRDFEEINLRFYVTRNENDQKKRGVVFIKEIVPKPFLAWVARTVYHENYVSMTTSHNVIEGLHYHYQWENSSVTIKSSGKKLHGREDSFERWITEHYWGYTRVDSEKTLEYEVKHPVWSLYEVTDSPFESGFSNLIWSGFPNIYDQKSGICCFGSRF